MTTFFPGDKVEFYSEDRGGCWKPGTVDSLLHEGSGSQSIRIRVGPKVCVIRPVDKVRRQYIPKTCKICGHETDKHVGFRNCDEGGAKYKWS